MYMVDRSAEEVNLGMEIMAECRRNPAIAKLFHDLEDDVKARLVKLLKTAAERGEINPSTDFESAAAMLMVIADGVYAAPGRRPQLRCRERAAAGVPDGREPARQSGSASVK